VKFGVVGVNHAHISGMSDMLLAAGASLSLFFAPEEDLATQFAQRYPDARRARSQDEVLEDPDIALIATAGIPDERGPLGIAAMRHGKDFLSDKPAFTDLSVLEQARQVQRETGRIYAISYSERIQNRAMVKAGELVKAGAIGRVLQTIGMGPHRLGAHARPRWFYEKRRYGGIITDIGAHQADHFLFYTGSTTAEVVCSQVGNLAHPEEPGLEDFGDAILHGDGGSGYFRVDWFTPDGVAAFGDGRFTILGTEGTIEVRKNVGADNGSGSYLLLADRAAQRFVDCSEVDLPYGRQLLRDIQERTETAMPQAHAFLAAELALQAEAQAGVLTRSAESVA
jgi:predicted dehydrogenase